LGDEENNTIQSSSEESAGKLGHSWGIILKRIFEKQFVKMWTI